MDLYLIWSNEHCAWWCAKAQGYTSNHEKAGRYTREAALSHCRVRDQRPGKPMPELPVRELDLMQILQTAVA
jgi:hypothetical protein